MSPLPPALSMKPMSIHRRGRIHFGSLSLSLYLSLSLSLSITVTHVLKKKCTHTAIYIYMCVCVRVQMYTHTPTHTYYIYIYICTNQVRPITHTKPYIKLMTHKPSCGWESLSSSQQSTMAHPWGVLVFWAKPRTFSRSRHPWNTWCYAAWR